MVIPRNVCGEFKIIQYRSAHLFVPQGRKLVSGEGKYNIALTSVIALLHFPNHHSEELMNDFNDQITVRQTGTSLLRIPQGLPPRTFCKQYLMLGKTDVETTEITN